MNGRRVASKISWRRNMRQQTLNQRTSPYTVEANSANSCRSFFGPTRWTSACCTAISDDTCRRMTSSLSNIRYSRASPRRSRVRSSAHSSRMMPRPIVSETMPMKLKSIAVSAAMMPATTSQSIRSRRRNDTAAFLRWGGLVECVPLQTGGGAQVARALRPRQTLGVGRGRGQRRPEAWAPPTRQLSGDGVGRPVGPVGGGAARAILLNAARFGAARVRAMPRHPGGGYPREGNTQISPVPVMDGHERLPTSGFQALDRMPSPDPLVSVVIPTFARLRTLRDCLDALGRQTLPSTRFEVVVVDDGGPEPLDAVVGEFASRLALRLVRQENAGPAAARNRGAREATGDLLAFTDDDCRPRPEWLERLVAGERDHPGALVGGTTVNGLPADVLATTNQLIIDLVYEHFNAAAEDAYFFASNNILCPRDRFLAIGGFDPGFPRAGAEDRDFCDRWRSAGLRLVWRPDATVEHRHAQTLGKFCDLHFRYGRGARLYQVKRRERGSGTMREDFAFHGTLPRRIWRRLGMPPGYRRSLQIAAAMILWQVVNAAGFFAQACLGRGRPAGAVDGSGRCGPSERSGS
ncbi:MAG: glycosyltransferase [Planctomycetia bacterium]|nr:glycosyltransferase [Planctomycetia bacterium]